MKALLLICDGLGGRPSDYDGQTCLETAEVPNIDKLSEKGSTGLLDPIEPGVRPGSDTSHLSLFGYDPFEVYTGRGVFEALGAGMKVGKNDVSFRTNFATVSEDFIVEDRRAGRIQEGQGRLEEALEDLDPKDPKVEVDFETSVEHRGALVLKGPGLSSSITDVDPHKTGKKVNESESIDGSESSKRTAEIVNDLVKQSHDILKDIPFNKEREENGKLPANILLLRGAATCPDIGTLEDLYGVKGVIIAGGSLYIGIGRYIGLEFKKAKGVTGGADSPIINKAKLAVEELNKGTEFVFVHMKGADSCGHDHDAECKISYLEKVDGVVEYLLGKLDWEETHVALTGDHATPINFGDHTSDPVPLLFAGPNVVSDEVSKFDERSVQKGGLGRISGRVVPMLFGYSDWLDKFGA